MSDLTRGLFAKLTADQKAKALSYSGPQDHGPAEFMRHTTPVGTLPRTFVTAPTQAEAERIAALIAKGEK